MVNESQYQYNDAAGLEFHDQWCVAEKLDASDAHLKVIPVRQNEC